MIRRFDLEREEFYLHSCVRAAFEGTHEVSRGLQSWYMPLTPHAGTVPTHPDPEQTVKAPIFTNEQVLAKAVQCCVFTPSQL